MTRQIILTEEELEQKAEEYARRVNENCEYGSYSCLDCDFLRELDKAHGTGIFGIPENECLRLVKQAYKDGFENKMIEDKSLTF